MFQKREVDFIIYSYTLTLELQVIGHHEFIRFTNCYTPEWQNETSSFCIIVWFGIFCNTFLIHQHFFCTKVTPSEMQNEYICLVTELNFR